MTIILTSLTTAIISTCLYIYIHQCKYLPKINSGKVPVIQYWEKYMVTCEVVVWINCAVAFLAAFMNLIDSLNVIKLK